MILTEWDQCTVVSQLSGVMVEIELMQYWEPLHTRCLEM